MVPPAPGLFSTMTVCPSVSVIDCWMARASWSVLPPAAYGTIMRIGLLGYVPCASAGSAPASSEAQAAHSSARRLGTKRRVSWDVSLVL
jgi:hypothetical protein